MHSYHYDEPLSIPDPRLTISRTGMLLGISVDLRKGCIMNSLSECFYLATIFLLTSLGLNTNYSYASPNKKSSRSISRTTSSATSFNFSGNNLNQDASNSRSRLTSNVAGDSISWVTVANGLQGNYVYGIASSPSGNMAAVAYYGGVYGSIDQGKNWTQLNFTDQVGLNSVVINSAGSIFLGSLGRGVYESTDNGSSWIQMNNGLKNMFVSSLAIDPSGDILAGTYGGIFKSINNGATWTEVDTELTNMEVYCISVSSSGRIFAAVGEEVLESSDNGITWNQINHGYTINNAWSVVANSSGTVFVGSYQWGVYKSTDNGSSWTLEDAGLTNKNVHGIAVDSSGDISVATDGGVFESTDNGSSWKAENSGLTNTSILTLTVTPSGYLFAGSGGIIYRSANTTATEPDYVVNAQFNRIPAVVSQVYGSTSPLRFSNYNAASAIDVDRGPLNISLIIKNPTNTAKYFRAILANLKDPEGKEVSPKVDYVPYFCKLSPGEDSLYQLMIRPPALDFGVFPDTGVWQANVQVQERNNYLAIGDKVVWSSWLPFDVKPSDKPLVESPSPDSDALGHIVVPNSVLTNAQSRLYHILEVVEYSLAAAGQDFGSSFMDFYQDMKGIEQQLNTLYSIRLKPENESQGERTFKVDIFKSGTLDFAYDRAVVIVSLPSGISKADVISAGGSHVVVNSSGRVSLIWIVNAIDERINWKYDWNAAPMEFTLSDNSLPQYQVSATLQLMVGPFQNDSLEFSSLKDAPWIYNYLEWRTNPSAMYWYPVTFAATNSYITNSNATLRTGHFSGGTVASVTAVIQNSFPYFSSNGLFLPDGTQLFVPANTYNSDFEIGWQQTDSVQSYPNGIVPSSNEYALGLDEQTQDSSAVHLTIVSNYSGTQPFDQSVFKWNGDDSSWKPVPSIVDSNGSEITTYVTQSGIYRTFQLENGSSKLPRVGLISPVGELISQTQPTFSWRDSTNIVWRYLIQIDTNKSFVSPILTTTVSSKKFQPPNPLKEGGYFWRVRRTTLDGFADAWSANGAFKIVGDTIPPTVTSVYPESGSSISPDSTVKMTFIDDGTGVDPSSIIFEIDSAEVGYNYSSATGTLTSNLEGELSEGHHVITANVSDYAGNKRSISIPFAVVLTGVAGKQTPPVKYRLYQNYPNPFNPTTTIEFDIVRTSKVTLSVFDILGQRITSLDYGELNAGTYKRELDLSRYASGVYFCRLQAVGRGGHVFQDTEKMLLLK